MKIKLSKQQMVDILYDGSHKLNKQVDRSRWSAHYRLVFELDGKLYETSYKQGLTEYQDEDPWDQDEVECTEVEEYKKTVIDYRPV